MEVINIEKWTFDEMMQRFEAFRNRMITLCDKGRNKTIEDWLDNQDVCLMLNISPRTLQSYRDTGKISFSQINHKIYYKPVDIEKLLKSDNTTNSTNNKNLKRR